jgi:hypothetical protein
LAALDSVHGRPDGGGYVLRMTRLPVLLRLWPATPIRPRPD